MGARGPRWLFALHVAGLILTTQGAADGGEKFHEHGYNLRLPAAQHRHSPTGKARARTRRAATKRVVDGIHELQNELTDFMTMSVTDQVMAAIGNLTHNGTAGRHGANFSDNRFAQVRDTAQGKVSLTTAMKAEIRHATNRLKDGVAADIEFEIDHLKKEMVQLIQAQSRFKRQSASSPPPGEEPLTSSQVNDKLADYEQKMASAVSGPADWDPTEMDFTHNDINVRLVPYDKGVPVEEGIQYIKATGEQECFWCIKAASEAYFLGANYPDLCTRYATPAWAAVLPMCRAIASTLQACPEFQNDWCLQEQGGSGVRMLSPCPMYLKCHYCLGVNPTHCLRSMLIGHKTGTDQVSGIFQTLWQDDGMHQSSGED